MKNKLNQTKCAPTKKYKDGSCFTLESLQNIAISYNKRNPKKKIEINLNKNKLVKELEERLNNKCNEQTCWLKLDFIKAMKNEDVDENTFRPEGPDGKFDWLSTTNINDVLQQYEDKFPNFVFLGAVPLDFDNLPILGISNLDLNDLIKHGKTHIGLIINHDEHWKNGSHWVGLFIDINKNGIYYFDSVGKPPLKLIKNFITRIVKYMYSNKYNENLPVNNIIKIIKQLNNISKDKLDILMNKKKYLNRLVNNFDIKYNSIQHQFDNSECGVYSINFILNMAENQEFDDVVNNIKKDKEMNENRKIFFRNVN